MRCGTTAKIVPKMAAENKARRYCFSFFVEYGGVLK
jgi:hypothetical protein